MAAMLFIMFWLVIVAGMMILWIWTLIDCINNEPSEGNDKVVWVVVIAAMNWIGALIYLIVRRPQRQATLGK
jgi:hypothetical protein